MRVRVIALLIVAVMMCGMAHAGTTLYVNETGWYRSGGAFNTTSTPIQHAVDNATAGDTVYVWNGSYSEDVSITTASLTLEGEGRDVVDLGDLYMLSDYVNISEVTCIDISIENADHNIVEYTEARKILSDHIDDALIQNNNLYGPMSFFEYVTNSIFQNNEFTGVALTGGVNDNAFTSNIVNFDTTLNVGLSSSGSNVNNTFTNIDFRGTTKASGNTAITCSSGFKNNTFTNTTFESSTAVLSIAVGADVEFIQYDRNIFVPMGGFWTWHYSPPAHYYSWTNQTVTGLNTTVDGLKSVMDFTDAVSASSGSKIYFNIPHFYFNPSSGSFNITDIVWNSTKHNNFYHWEDHYSNDVSTSGVKSFNATATDPAATASIQCGDFARGTPIQMLVNGIDNGTVTATYAGIASFSYTSGFSGEMHFNISTKNKTGTTIFHDVINNVTPNGDINYSDWVVGYDSINTTIIPETGSVEICINQSILNVNYHNTNIYDLNITDLDGTLLLKDDDVSTMMFSIKNNLHISLWDIYYWINATSNRKAVEMKTYATDSDLQLNFTVFDLFPSSNFDCHYNTASFITNTSNSSGVLLFGNPSWTPSTTKLIEIYMTTTPYSCGGGCAVDEGDPMMLYLDLNNTDVTHVLAEITKPNGEKANHSMNDFWEDGVTTWYLQYVDTGVAGMYTVNNFYSSEDGVTYQRYDSFLTFESRSSSGGGGGGTTPADDGDDGGAGGGGGGAQPAPTPDESGIKPDKEFIGNCIEGVTTFTGSIVISVESPGCSRVTVGEYHLNPTTTSLIGGTRHGYAKIDVADNPEIGGTVTFRVPDGAEDVALYQLEDNMWIELSSTRVGDTISADVEHFSYFAIAKGGMESVIESMTKLTLTPPKVSGILVWKWLSDTYTSTHIANRELMNVSASEGMICEILTTGDYANRTLKCTYTPPEDEEWSSLKYTGEIIAIDTDGYTRRIPVGVNVYDMDKLGFTIFAGIILLIGIILYRKYD